MAKKKCDPCNVNTTSFPDMFKALCCQMAEINASLSESSSASGETNEKLDTVNENLEKVLESLTLMLEEMTNDDNFGDTLWEAPNGDIVIKRTVKKDDGTVVDEYLNPDGTPYTGSTSDLKPYTRQTVITTTDYCANSVPFTLIQFRDHDTKEVIATIWRNDDTLAEQVTAPTGATKGVCVATQEPTIQVTKCFKDSNDIRVMISGLQTPTTFTPIVVIKSGDLALYPLGGITDVSMFTEVECLGCCN
jgi:hypothetical protein